MAGRKARGELGSRFFVRGPSTWELGEFFMLPPSWVGGIPITSAIRKSFRKDTSRFSSGANLFWRGKSYPRKKVGLYSPHAGKKGRKEVLVWKSNQPKKVALIQEEKLGFLRTGQKEVLFFPWGRGTRKGGEKNRCFEKRLRGTKNFGDVASLFKKWRKEK